MASFLPRATSTLLRRSLPSTLCRTSRGTRGGPWSASSAAGAGPSLLACRFSDLSNQTITKIERIQRAKRRREATGGQGKSEEAKDAPAPAFPATYEPPFELKSGWTPPPPEDALNPDVPFRVTRTGKGKSLPVYSDYRMGKTRINTLVRKISGDVEAMAQELQKVCGGAFVEQKAGGLVVRGNYVRVVKQWLAGLGF